MSDVGRSLDPQGEARGVLQDAVSNYGPQVLDNVDLIEGICADQLSDWPREASLIVSAAGENVAAKLAEQIVSIGPDTAVRLSASTLADSRSLDPFACQWVVSEVARALGHEVSLPLPLHEAVTPSNPRVETLVPPPLQRPQQFETIVPADVAGGYPPAPPAPPAPPVPMVPAVVPQGPAQSKRSKSGALIAVAAVLVLAAVYLVAATLAKLPPFAAPATTTIASVGTTSTLVSSPSSTSPAGASARLQAAIPSAFWQTGTCKASRSPYGNSLAEVLCNVGQSSTFPVTRIGYLMYGDSSSLVSGYSSLLQQAKISLGAGSCGSFSTFAAPCETVYSVKNVTKGHIFEYANGKTPTICWTYTAGSNYLLMVANGSTSNDNGMVTWWSVLPFPWIASSSTG
ncbi:MAG: hypothetical protein ACYDGN_14920 [Acidimicrobiales bacterium]